MSYIVLKSTPSDDGWVHEPVMWTVSTEQALLYTNTQNFIRDDIPSEQRERFNVIETDMTGWIDPCEGQGVYQCGIGGYFYIDESKLDL